MHFFFQNVVGIISLSLGLSAVEEKSEAFPLRQLIGWAKLTWPNRTPPCYCPTHVSQYSKQHNCSPRCRFFTWSHFFSCTSFSVLQQNRRLPSKYIQIWAISHFLLWLHPSISHKSPLYYCKYPLTDFLLQSYPVPSHSIPLVPILPILSVLSYSTLFYRTLPCPVLSYSTHNSHNSQLCF